ncbi:MlaD family protein [Euzebya sp.]|uniref:MlaD family protein n=1 Tax=Euzebya sp. TaxID=1971409 RepID=UPI0035182FB6
MKRSRTFINLVTVIIASAVLLLFAATQLLASAVLDNTYTMYVELPEAGGLLEDKEVTYRGVGVGSVEEVYLCGEADAEALPDCEDAEGVLVEMGIENDIEIPTEVDVVVLRQSAVGEQALDIRPTGAVGPETAFHAAEEVIRPGSITLPTKPQDLLELANEVFAPVDAQDAATVVAELADAVEGRSEDIRSILVDSATLSEAVGDNGTDFDRFFASSRTVNATLAENREELAQLITDLADSAELVGDIRGEVDGLLDTAPTVLDATTSLLARGRANLACSIRDLADLNTFVNQPENLANLEEAIRVNQYFFEAFRIIGPTSIQGDPWLRVQFLLEPQPTPVLYDPARPVPATLPGGACESVFGPGAGAAVQPNHQLAVPRDGEVIRPENDRRTSVTQVAAQPPAEPGVGAAGVAPVGVDETPVADSGSTTASPLVVTVLALGVGALGLGWRLGGRPAPPGMVRRRRRSGRAGSGRGGPRGGRRG